MIVPAIGRLVKRNPPPTPNYPPSLSIEACVFIEQAADKGSPDLQGYGSYLAFIQDANINNDPPRSNSPPPFLGPRHIPIFLCDNPFHLDFLVRGQTFLTPTKSQHIGKPRSPYCHQFICLD